jgi:hypothetical protein
MTTAVIVSGLCLCVLAIYRYIIYPAYLSPLSSIPRAHWSTPYSSLWILLARKNGYENRALLEAHQSKGSVVRVGPNALSVDGVDAIRTVYGGGFEKDSWYHVFDNYGFAAFKFFLIRHKTDSSQGAMHVFS